MHITVSKKYMKPVYHKFFVHNHFIHNLFIKQESGSIHFFHLLYDYVHGLYNFHLSQSDLTFYFLNFVPSKCRKTFSTE